MENLTISLVDLLGAEYVDSVCRAAASLGLGDEKSLQSLGREKVECWPADYAEKVRNLLQKSGERICEPFVDNNTGAPTDAFGSHTNLNAAPLTGMGPYRLQEDGRLAIIGKSEHSDVTGSAVQSRLTLTCRSASVPSMSARTTRSTFR